MPVSPTCEQCAKSKVRCIRDPHNPSVCNRCCRLGKECIYRQTTRQFRGFKKDRQIKALKSQVHELLADRSPSSVDTCPSGGTSHGPVTQTADGKDVIDRGLVDMMTAQVFIDRFSSSMSVHFPFVVVPPDVTAMQLRQERPFLFLAILASASYSDVPLQRLLGQEVKKVISNRIILDGEVSFDLLQGLLVFLAWSHYHSKPHRYTQFLQLAIGLLVELRLDRPPRTKTWKTSLKFRSDYELDDEDYARPSWGADEQRAIVGCYYLSSTIAVLLQKPSCFPDITPYLESCCQYLYDSNHTPQDQYIMQLFKLQRIAERISGLSWNHGAEITSSSSVAELYVSAVKSDLETLRRQLPPNFHESPVLAMQLYTTELCLYQLSLTKLPQPSTGIHVSVPSASRDEIFYAGLAAAESVLNLYLALPLGAELGFSNTQWVQIGFCLLVACRQVVAASMKKTSLIMYTHTWPDTLAKLRQRVAALATDQTDHNGHPDVFVEFDGRVSRIQGWFNKMFQPERHVVVSDHSILDNLSIDPGLPQGISAELQGSFGYGDNYFSDDPLISGSIEQIMGGWI
ncbi:hypothetical protein BDV25DRAFT_136042 [Aspergillus avenaceus]|uniref:Zn(2)-C6 fungal-type domain-containing protein n=1 Tax=Aspergillus avenaceus TaxID=36643 RepID=A0A5N6U6T0_ASPAV|nr:hypothetical protein BDV25DRAFT_136042 [Aspergillus avenaceus]